MAKTWALTGRSGLPNKHLAPEAAAGGAGESAEGLEHVPEREAVQRKVGAEPRGAGSPPDRLLAGEAPALVWGTGWGRGESGVPEWGRACSLMTLAVKCLARPQDGGHGGGCRTPLLEEFRGLGMQLCFEVKHLFSLLLSVYIWWLRGGVHGDEGMGAVRPLKPSVCTS